METYKVLREYIEDAVEVIEDAEGWTVPAELVERIAEFSFENLKNYCRDLTEDFVYDYFI